jgi:uncharacterized SAM-binding protein YcdF (DUF218 family)
MKQPRARRVIVWLALSLMLADAATCAVLLVWSRACCSQSLEALGSDQVVVLLYGSEADLDLRIPEAERLLRLNPAAPFLCAGGARPDRNIFHCQDVVEILARDGFDRSRLAADTASFDTRGNIAVAFDVAGPTQVPVFVSDSLHLLRARILADGLEPGRPYAMSATPGPKGLYLLARLHWEILAYFSDLVPSWLRDAGLKLTRN